MCTCRQFFDAVDTNLFQLGSTNPKKNSQTLDVFFGGGLVTYQRKTDFFLFVKFFFLKNFQIHMKDLRPFPNYGHEDPSPPQKWPKLYERCGVC